MALDAGNKIVNTNTGLVADGRDISGGYFSTPSLASIPSYSNVIGALCYVTEGTDAGKYFKYNGTTWVEAKFGSGDVTDVKVDNTSILDSEGVANLKTSSSHPYSQSNPLATLDDVSSAGGGTVTSIAAGTGLKTDRAGGAPITNSGTISVDTDTIATKNDLTDKQDVIDSSHKLSSDLVDDTDHTNKFVTASEKTLIGTATQPGDNVSTLTNDAGYVKNLSDLGITAIASELNTLDGITATTSELNMLSGTTEYTAAEVDTLWESI